MAHGGICTQGQRVVIPPLYCVHHGPMSEKWIRRKVTINKQKNWKYKYVEYTFVGMWDVGCGIRDSGCRMRDTSIRDMG